MGRCIEAKTHVTAVTSPDSDGDDIESCLDILKGDEVRFFNDCFGHRVRLTDERLAHILEHPEMHDMEPEIEKTLAHPIIVRVSRSDAATRLFYRFYAQTKVGGKWLCIMLKYRGDDAFVVTAYLTNVPKAGEDLWPTK